MPLHCHAKNTHHSPRAHTYVDVHALVHAVGEEEVVRELEAVGLHGVARPVVVVTHIAVVKVGHALLARAVRHRGDGGSINAASTTPQFDQLLGSTGAVRRGRCFGGSKCEERDETAGEMEEDEGRRGDDDGEKDADGGSGGKAWGVMGQERTLCVS